MPEKWSDKVRIAWECVGVVVRDVRSDVVEFLEMLGVDAVHKLFGVAVGSLIIPGVAAVVGKWGNIAGLIGILQIVSGAGSFVYHRLGGGVDG